MSKTIPGGAAAGGTASYTMLGVNGATPERIVSGLTAAALISNAVLFALPVLSLPAIVLEGVTVAAPLLRALIYGIVVFVALLGVGAVALFTDRPLAATGRLVQRVRNRIMSKRAPTTDLPAAPARAARLHPHHAGAAVVAGAPVRGRQLAARLRRPARGAGRRRRPPRLAGPHRLRGGAARHDPDHPRRPRLRRGRADATLRLAGVGPAEATLATLAYRLVSFWLPIPTGGVAYLLYRRRYGARSPSAEPALAVAAPGEAVRERAGPT